MEDISTNILGILLGILLFTFNLIFMALIIYAKKGFRKIFNNIDLIVKIFTSDKNVENNTKVSENAIFCSLSF
jgi:hypothetical protein